VGSGDDDAAIQSEVGRTAVAKVRVAQA
jgi:hypothetical protein